MALDNKISLNPILNSFQITVHKFNIDYSLIEAFLKSMRWDLNKKEYLEFINKVALSSKKSITKYEEGSRGKDLVKIEMDEFKKTLQNLNKIIKEINYDN